MIIRYTPSASPGLLQASAMLHRPSCSSSRVSSTLRHVGLQPRLSPHLEVVPHDEGQLPEAGEGLGGAGRDHAVVEYLVVQGVGPAGGLVLGRVTHQHSLLDF